MAAADMSQQRKDGESGFKTPLVVLSVLAVVFFVIAFALFMQGGFLKAQDLEKTAKIYDAPAVETVAAAMAEQQAKLDGGYRWVDKEAGLVGMPIDDAKDQLVKTLARKESEF